METQLKALVQWEILLTVRFRALTPAVPATPTPDEIRELSAYVCATRNFHADNSRISSGIGVA